MGTTSDIDPKTPFLPDTSIISELINNERVYKCNANETFGGAHERNSSPISYIHVVRGSLGCVGSKSQKLTDVQTDVPTWPHALTFVCSTCVPAKQFRPNLH